MQRRHTNKGMQSEQRIDVLHVDGEWQREEREQHSHLQRRGGECTPISSTPCSCTLHRAPCRVLVCCPFEGECERSSVRRDGVEWMYTKMHHPSLQWRML